MQRIAVLIVLGGAARADISAPPAGPSPGPAATVHWLTARDGLPAAATGKGVIEAPVYKAACRWVTVGSRWHVVDAAGAVVGETRVTRLESSEPWPCLMASLQGEKLRRDRGRLLLAATAPPPTPTRIWTPSPAERAAFGSLLRGHTADHETIFFEMRDGRFAAGTGKRGVALVARLVGGAWKVEWDGTRRVIHDNHRVEYYHLPAAIDLDADGEPEVIFGWSEDTEYGDSILRRSGSGWHIVAESFEGNTI